MKITLRVIDCETTGLPPEAEVVEWAHTDVTKEDDGPWTIGATVSNLHYVAAIPPAARAVHHISAGEVANALPFDARDVHGAAAQADVFAFVAHHLAFEDQFLGERTRPGICTMKAAYRVWPQAPGHSNQVLRYWLEDEGLLGDFYPGRALPAHRAGADTYVTAHLLLALLATASGKDMVAWTKEPPLLPTCPIGKFRGKPWSDVEAGFLGWMLAQPTMEADLKWNAQRELSRRTAGG